MGGAKRMHAVLQSKLTYEDFVRFPEDGRRHELIDGVHYVTPSPVTVHQRLLMRLGAALSYALGDLGEVFPAPFDVVLSEHDIVEPDLLVVLKDQAADILTEQHVRGAPALVIEILSPGTRRRDEGIKRKLYESAGVREYWIVNPRGRTITVFVRTGGGGFGPPATCGNTDTLTTPLVPGLALDVEELFAGPDA